MIDLALDPFDQHRDRVAQSALLLVDLVGHGLKLAVDLFEVRLKAVALGAVDTLRQSRNFLAQASVLAFFGLKSIPERGNLAAQGVVRTRLGRGPSCTLVGFDEILDAVGELDNCLFKLGDPAVAFRQQMMIWALALILGGALGNVVDRARLGYVVDFIVWKWTEAYRWPTFNLADTFIVVGVALMLLVAFRPQGILGKKKEMTFVK